MTVGLDRGWTSLLLEMRLREEILKAHQVPTQRLMQIGERFHRA
jgi:hypothetical protein